MHIRHQLENFDADSDEYGLCCRDESLAKQSFAEECDINTIVKRFGLTGQLPEGVHMPTYGDFSDIYDFHSAMNAIAQARESFEAMPAEVRARFNNDPGAFVDFCSNDKNREEAEKLGLVPAKAGATAPAGSVPATASAASGEGPKAS